MSRRRALLAPVLAAALLLAGCTSTGLQSPDSNVDGVSEWFHPTGKPVDFSGRTVDGTMFRSSAQRGKVLVVNIWYADCPPCNAEAPALKSLATEYASKGVAFVGLNTQDGGPQAKAFEQQYRMPYPSILDDANGGAAQLALASAVPTSAVPSTVVLDRKGRVVSRVIGQADPSTLATLIDDAVDGKAA